MKGKKLFAMILVITLLTGLMAACSQTGTSTTQTSGQTTTKATTTSAGTTKPTDEPGGYSLPLVDEPFTLVYMYADTQVPGASYADGRANAVIEAEKATGVTIEWDLTPNSEYNDILQLRLASQQNLPDMLRLRGGQEGAYLTGALADGVIIRLNDLIEQYGVNYRRIMEEYPIVRESASMPDGSIVGFHKTQPESYSYAAQLIRMDWLENVGMDMPTTLDEFLEVAIAFVEKDPNKTGEDDTYGMHAANPSGNMFEYNQLATSFGLGLCTGSGWSVRDGKVTFEFVLPAAREYLKWFRKVVDAGVLPPDYTSVTYPEHDARVASGKVGLLPRGWPGNAVAWRDPSSSMMQNQPEALWGLVPALTPPEGTDLTGVTKRMIKEPTVRRSNAICITTACERPDIAFKWLDWATYSEEGILLNSWGIEGVTYERKPDGSLAFLDSEMLDNRPQADGTWLGFEHVELFIDNRRTEAIFKKAGISLDDEVILQIKANWPYLVEPFYPPMPTVEEGKELNRLLSEVNTYRNEMWAKFCDGSMPIDENWDEYVSRLNSLGLTRILEIYQKGYDAANR